MRRTIVSIATTLTLSMGLVACSSPSDPTPTPSATPGPAVSSPEKPTTAPVPTPGPTETDAPEKPSDPEPTKKPEPTPAPATSEAGTPATQFAQRWGKRYPDVPEFAILKAANATCRAIEASGNDWNKDPIVTGAISLAIQAAGLSENDAIEFAQDADQNYCASVANPT